MPEGRLTPLHVFLFIATCFSTLVAGAMMQGVAPWKTPGLLVKGIPFSVSLMTILLTHEMGHYFMSRRHGTPASLPYFIPAPSLIGTFGAVIRMRPPIIHSRALMDIGAAGPLAGFAVSVAAAIIGLRYSPVSLSFGTPPSDAFSLGDSLMFKLLTWLVLGVDPATHDVMLHPIAFAGWIGFFVTTLNLLPVGQLDGGHICYALFGPERHEKISKIMIPVLLVPGYFFWPGWAVWGVLLIFLGRRHPPVELPWVMLDPMRRNVGWASLAVFALTFTPTPFSGF
jgi:membrane-associated protease RseP (regulator of RpoE activity)